MSSVDDFIAKHEREKREIIEALRKLILEAGPNIEERLAHHIPFYYYYGRFCYINPVKDGVDLGFCHGMELGNEQGILEAKERVEVRSICIRSLDHFPVDAIREILQEALLLNEWRAQNK
ncbi:MAG: DUF1801 domain-containing protein [Marinifilaceae bacterium]